MAPFVAGALFITLFMPPIGFAQLDWVATETGYRAQQLSQRAQEFCICEAYACGGEAEPVHIAFDGWLTRRYAIIRDPEAVGESNWGRRVVTETRCVHKDKGEQVTLRLSDGRLNGNGAGLLLEIE